MVQIKQLDTVDIMTFAKTFAESGMFTDTREVAKAFVKIQAGQEIGIPPFAAMTGIHIIAGKPAIGAGLMAARVKGSGKYDYKVVESTDKACSIDFYQGKDKIGNSSFTIQEATKAGTKNLDKFPKNMLFARAISNGVKFYCPDVFSGPVYIPEEIDSTTEETEDVSYEVLSDPETDLRSVSSLEELKSVYQSLSKEDKVKFKDLKDEMKSALDLVEKEGGAE